jgi:hypothetical protein
MTTVIIAKNQTAGDLALTKLSAPDSKIPASGQVTLTDYNFVWDIQEDAELRAHITAGDVLLNVDGVDLDQAESLVAASPPAPSKDTDTLHRAQNEPTGFPNRTDSTISRVDGSRTFTVQPAVTDFDFYIAGTKFTKTAAQTKVWNDAEGLHYFYFDAAGVLQVTQVFSEAIILQYAFVALLYWDFTNKASILFADERHGIQMNGQTHLHFHLSFGARWMSGLALQGITADGDGNVNASAQFAVQDGYVRDEDIQFLIQDGSPQDLTPTAQIPIYHRVGAAGDWRKKAADNFPMVYQGTAGYPATQRLPFNEFTGGVWGLTQISTGNFICMHYFGTNNTDEPVIGIQGQIEYLTVADARVGAQSEIKSVLFGSLPTPELVPLGTVIFQSATTYGNTPKARVRSDSTGAPYVDFRRTDLVGFPGTEATAFGANYQREESLGEQSTSSINWDQTKVTLTTPALTGTYRVAWSAMYSSTDKPGQARLYNLTDTAVVGEIQPFRIKDAPDRYPTYGKAHEVVFTGAAKTFQLQWRGPNGDSVSIKDAYIEIWRIGP